MPDLSSAEIRQPTRHLKLGRYRLPIGAPHLKLLRKSIPFWKILDQYRIPSSVLRVPITFPADRFAGTMLSAMCVPDLQGTQGSYSYFFTGPVVEKSVGGREVQVKLEGDRIAGEMLGPENPILPGEVLKAPFTVRLGAGGGATLEISGKQHELPLGAYTDWIQVDFGLGLGLSINGICRFRLLESGERFRLYATPVNIDPSKPVLPISHPQIFSIFLSKLIGRFSTLGLAEDTWALNEGVLDEQAFLDQVDGIHGEREKMFFEMLDRTRRGVLACVFDSTDRVQHMFMRFLDPADPSAPKSEYADVIPDTYARMDTMVARVFDQVDIEDPETLVVVMSDHGFKSFRRGVNLNSWLHQNGYLALKEGKERSGEWFESVDWDKTRAFALGLGGIFINQRGREAKGIVAPEDVKALTDELTAKLNGLVDPLLGKVAIQEAYSADKVFTGPYRDKAPNLIVGYAAGWRASWDGVRGIVDDVVFDDNDKAWSGDHCIDPKLVPGVLIANQNLAANMPEPSIQDIAPTLLDLFGIPTPKHMDGRSLAPA
jgi:predicted AlkP superfamily phosphohydrolase/phosphomutase